MVNRFYYFVFFLALFFWTACVPDKLINPDKNPVNDGSRRVWVVNEGSLGNGNASLSVIFPDKDSIYNNVYKTANGQTLGDVFQSMTMLGEHAFLAINNSDNIKVIDKNNFKLLTEIRITKPRFMLLANERKMYVGSLFHSGITILNPQSFQIVGKIETEFKNIEGMLLHEGKVYACAWDTACNFIYEIDPQRNEITNRIQIAGYAPQQLVADKEGMLWVIAGNSAYKKKSTLTRLDPKSHKIMESFVFESTSDFMKPVFNSTKDTLYFLGVDYNDESLANGVFKMPINATNLPTQPFISSKKLQYFWALGIDPVTGKIYVGDPKGFIQQGSVQVYNQQGQLLQQYATELGPGFFYFE